MRLHRRWDEDHDLKTALITGITGQDGAYLSRFLLEKGYEVVGAYRRSSTSNFWRLEYLDVLGHPNLRLIDIDITDLSSCLSVLAKTNPDEVYNLAAQSFVGVSFDQPLYTAQATGLSALNLLEAIRLHDASIRFYQASTSEMYGKVAETPQTEMTPFHPRSPYATAKLFAHSATINHREAYGLHASSGILFNHESPLRGEEFVTRKITKAVSRIVKGKQSFVGLGNLDAKRDWGHAEDYIKAMYLMVQQDQPDTFVVATNQTRKVRDFASTAFEVAGMPLVFEGVEKEEVGRDPNGIVRVRVNEQFFRPAEVDLLLGDYKKAKTVLGWSPTITFDELVETMVEADLDRS